MSDHATEPSPIGTTPNDDSRGGIFAPRLEPEFDAELEAGNAVDFRREGPERFSFAMRPDTRSDDRQWFHFRLRSPGGAGRELTLVLRDTGATNVPIHWDTARPVVSYDGGATWRRTQGTATHDPGGGTFAFSETLEADTALFASHYPYDYSDYLERRAVWERHRDCRLRTIGASVQGRPIDLLEIASLDGAPRENRLGVWVTSRLHAAETTASWMLDGFLDFLLSDDERASRLRRSATVQVVPFVNPDGAVLGNYRDNAAGENLNRRWMDADRETSPEIVAVKEAIAASVAAGRPYHFFADLHSDSETLANYIFGAIDPGARSDLYPDPARYNEDTRAFIRCVARYSADFRSEPHPDADSTDPRFSRVFQMVTYGVLAVIFEGTYSYPKSGPNAGSYMTPARHAGIGRAFGLALHDYYAARGRLG